MCANIKLYLRKRKMHIINFCKFRVGIQRQFSLEISCQFCCSMSFLSSRLKIMEKKNINEVIAELSVEQLAGMIDHTFLKPFGDAS